jgi:hypothetical protein
MTKRVEITIRVEITEIETVGLAATPVTARRDDVPYILVASRFEGTYRVRDAFVPITRTCHFTYLANGHPGDSIIGTKVRDIGTYPWTAGIAHTRVVRTVISTDRPNNTFCTLIAKRVAGLTISIAAVAKYNCTVRVEFKHRDRRQNRDWLSDANGNRFVEIKEH